MACSSAFACRSVILLIGSLERSIQLLVGKLLYNPVDGLHLDLLAVCNRLDELGSLDYVLGRFAVLNDEQGLPESFRQAGNSELLDLLLECKLVLQHRIVPVKVRHYWLGLCDDSR